MNTLKRILAVLLMFAVVSVGLTGCNNQSEHPSGDHPTSEHPSGEHPN